jgi:hypothetical protein
LRGRPSKGAGGNTDAGSRRTANAVCAQQRSTSAVSITRRRPSRSAIAPLTGSDTTIATTLAANTIPSDVADPCRSRTAQEIAIDDIAVPSSDVEYPT